MHNNNVRVLLSKLVVLLLLTTFAFGQDSTTNKDSDSDSDNASLGEISEAFIVTGTSKARKDISMPFSVTQVSEDRLEQFSAGSQADILRTLPGIKAEGGGGEVASNVFIKGLPSGGQFQFTPLMYDGLPVFSTFGLNSSAFDVYYRGDIGVEQMEFVRGGVSNLFGSGSVAGIINYISKTGSFVPETEIQFELAEDERMRTDFFTGGPLSEDSNTYYALSGFYRYDEGPLDTGLPTEGFQIRGNLRKVFNDGSGSVTFYGQVIDDSAQFFLPFPLDGSSRERTLGNDGGIVNTVQTAEAQGFTYQTPGGVFRTPIGDGVVTSGSSFAAVFEKDLENGWAVNSRMRYAIYDHQFNLFLDGDGIVNTPETLAGFLETRGLGSLADAVYTSTRSGRTLPDNYLLFPNRLLDRDRPARDFSTEFNLTKTLEMGDAEHTFTAGFFFSRSEADDDNVITTYLAEFNDRPGLVDLTVTDVDGSLSGTPGAEVIISRNGLLNAGASFSNNTVEARRMAGYLADQIESGKFIFDIGFRFEEITGDISREGSENFFVPQTQNLSNNQYLASDLETIRYGNSSFTMGRVDDTEWAGSFGVLYRFSDELSYYGNYSRGFFFPQLRSVQFNSFGDPASYDGEIITQAEGGVKYAAGDFAASGALFFAKLEDRANVDFVNDGQGGVIEEVSLQSTETLGVELAATYRFTNVLTFDGNLTYQDHELTQNEANPSLVGNELRRQPNLMANAGLYFNNGKWDASVFANHVGDNFANDSNSVELEAFTILRFDGGYTHTFSERSRLKISLGIFNLTDDEGITEGSPRQGSAQSATGNFFVGRPILPRRTTLKISYKF